VAAVPGATSMLSRSAHDRPPSSTEEEEKEKATGGLRTAMIVKT
jgi:hypothetical protein